MSEAKAKSMGSTNTLQFIPDWAEFGTASVETLLKGAPHVDALAKEGVPLPGSRFLQVIYEMDMFSSQALLPPSLAPVRGSAFVMFRAYDFPEAPWGPTRVVLIGTLCRFGYRPRVFQMSAKTDNPAAVEALRSGWGMPVTATEKIDMRRYHDGTHVTVTDGGKKVLTIQTTEPILTAGGSMGINSSVNLVDTPNGSRLVQVAEEFTFTAAEVGTPKVGNFVQEAWGLEGVNPRYPVSAVTAAADITLRPVQFVADTEAPSLHTVRPVDEI